MTPQIDHTWNGQAIVQWNGIMYMGQRVTVKLYPRFGLVQAGSGDKWIPEKQIDVGKSYRFQVGDFEVTVKRTKASKGSDPKVINLSEVRQRRQRAKGEG